MLALAAPRQGLPVAPPWRPQRIMTTIQEQLGQILHKMGGIEAKLEVVMREQADATQSRRHIYEHLDTVREDIGEVRRDIAIAVQVSKQANEAAVDAADRLDKHIKMASPVLRRMRRIDARLALIFAAGGAVAGAIWALVSSNWSAILETIKRLLP